MSTPPLRLDANYTPREAYEKLAPYVEAGGQLRERAAAVADLLALDPFDRRRALHFPREPEAWLEAKRSWVKRVDNVLPDVFAGDAAVVHFRLASPKGLPPRAGDPAEVFTYEREALRVKLETLKGIAGAEHAAGRSLQVFLSHASDDRVVVLRLKEVLKEDFCGFMEIFVSADPSDIVPGDEWLGSIREDLRKSDVLLVLCTPTSRERLWVHFEAGAAWGLGKAIIPVCHGGLRPQDVPSPLSLHQAVLLTDPRGLRALYERLSDIVGGAIPVRSFDDLAISFAQAEAEH